MPKLNIYWEGIPHQHLPRIRLASSAHNLAHQAAQDVVRVPLGLELELARCKQHTVYHRPETLHSVCLERPTVMPPSVSEDSGSTISRPEVPRRTHSQRKELSKFAKGLEKHLVAQQALHNAALSTSQMTCTTSASCASIHTIVDFLPYLAEFQAAGLSVTSDDQRRRPTARSGLKSKGKQAHSKHLLFEEAAVSSSRTDNTVEQDSCRTGSLGSTVIEFEPHHTDTAREHNNARNGAHPKKRIPWLRNEESPSQISSTTTATTILYFEPHPNDVTPLMLNSESSTPKQLEISFDKHESDTQGPMSTKTVWKSPSRTPPIIPLRTVKKTLLRLTDDLSSPRKIATAHIPTKRCTCPEEAITTSHARKSSTSINRDSAQSSPIEAPPTPMIGRKRTTSIDMSQGNSPQREVGLIALNTSLPPSDNEIASRHIPLPASDIEAGQTHVYGSDISSSPETLDNIGNLCIHPSVVPVDATELSSIVIEPTRHAGVDTEHAESLLLDRSVEDHTSIVASTSTPYLADDDNDDARIEDRDVLRGLKIAMAAACDENIDGWIQEITGCRVRRFLADLKAFDGLGVNELAHVAKRAASLRSKGFDGSADTFEIFKASAIGRAG